MIRVCSVEKSRGSDEQEVVGEDAKLAFPLLHGPRAGAESGTKPPLVPAECALGLPALTEIGMVNPTLHFSSVSRRRPASVCAEHALASHREQSGTNAGFLPAKTMIVLSIVALVPEQLVDGMVRHGLPDHGR